MNRTVIQESIHLLFSGIDLEDDQADATMSQIMRGDASPAQIGAFLAALRMKGETVDEIFGCARAMKRGVIQVHPETNGAPLFDIGGTGGDNVGTFNISTTAAFVLAGRGRKVAKHGSRAVSSRCGSADVMSALGANINLNANQAATCIEELGIAFLFAPDYHPALRYALEPRRELATRTIFNVLGPLINPADASHQVMGVYDPALTGPLAEVLNRLGRRAAFVMHGAGGLDEFSVTGVNQVSHLRDGHIATFELDPTDLGIPRARVEDLLGGEPETNAAIMRGILSGEILGPKRDAVLLTAGAAFCVDSGDWETGIKEARESIDSGAAAQVLEAFICKTRALR